MKDLHRVVENCLLYSGQTYGEVAIPQWIVLILCGAAVLPALCHSEHYMHVVAIP